MSLPYSTNPESLHQLAIKQASSLRRIVLHFGVKKNNNTFSNNNLKCGKLFIGYSKINCIINYTIDKLFGVMTVNISFNDSDCSPM